MIIFNFKILSKLTVFYALFFIIFQDDRGKAKIIIICVLNNIDLKISIIIPTFNRGELITNSIKSVLNQTFQNLEVIIVDDGSSDNTKEIVKKIKDKRIKYIRLKENKGASNARNIGIKNAHGQYISFQDSDDIFYPNKLEEQLKNIINKRSNFDFCKINVIYNDSFSYFYPNKIVEDRLEKTDFFNELISHGNFISTQSILVEKEIIKNYIFDPNLPRLQDYDLILRMIPKLKISYTKKVLVDLHIQKNSLTRSPMKLKHAIEILLIY